ncbi:glycosyltransferase family 39 protein [Halobellus rarus]|uniref:Glycosyltransferase family 39 protein n=1 Tax=Halobellus rarus TaxID=1126237 RepID=A0ABD6CN37_9EURY|nr:glycosyltransferase family 39 protein [Halobellus rarus]
MTGSNSPDPPGRGRRWLLARLRSVAADTRAAVPIDDDDRLWLALGLLPGVVAVAIYLATNPYPAYGAGLYAKIAAEIVANGYSLPAWIPGYTADGVPFAYPPLQFYLYALLVDLGGDPVTVSRFLPSLGMLFALVPIYLLGRDAADSRPAGTAAAALVALNPQILEWHLSAGGVVRAFAFLYATTSIYAGYRVFVHDGVGGRRAVALGAIAFGLTVLTHPVYSLFVVVSYVLFWLVRDRSLSGFASGLAVGLGGALLASPWLVWVLTTHGIGVFAAASGTHGGVGGGANALAGAISPGVAVALVPAVYLLLRREYLLPVWLVVAELLFRQPRFAYAVSAVLVPVAVVVLVRARESESEAIPERAGDGSERKQERERSESEPRRRRVGPDIDRRAAAAAAVLLLGTLVGGAYFAYETTLVTDPSTPEFLDEDDDEAMAWIAAETDPGARFVVVGDAAEWLPALTDRTLLVGYWGVEWVGADAFDRQMTAYETVSTCQRAECVESVAADVGERPTHVYVPKGQYTIRGENAAQFGTIERSFERSDRWERAYENDGVVIYRATDTDGS